MTNQIHGAYEVKNGDVLTKDNFPQESTVFFVARGERIIDENGKETPLRGARVAIENNNTTAAINPLINIPAIVLERQIVALEEGASFTFYNKCVINFGKVS